MSITSLDLLVRRVVPIRGQVVEQVNVCWVVELVLELELDRQHLVDSVLEKCALLKYVHARETEWEWSVLLYSVLHPARFGGPELMYHLVVE